MTNLVSSYLSLVLYHLQSILLPLDRVAKHLVQVVGAVLHSLVAMPSIRALYVGKDFPPGPALPIPLLRIMPGTRYYKV